jgi:hypothetical protein
MPEFDRKSFKMIIRGMVLGKAGDLLAPDEYAVLQNVRSYSTGVLIQRPGMTAINPSPLIPTGNATIHSIRRLNDDVPGAANQFLRVVGAGTGLYAGTSFTGTELTAIATGFSGNPLSLIPHRPTQSPEPFMYVGDANKMGKVKDNRTFRNMGIAPPIGPSGGPSSDIPTLSSFQSTTIETGINTAASWVAGTGLFAVVNTGGFPTDTITAALYDTGSTGWASIGITTPGDSRLYQDGAMVTMDGSGAEVVIIDSVYTSIKTTTISSITYDTGATGLCTIVLASHKRRALVPNVLIKIDSEYVRVLSVAFGPDGLPSLRCSTTSNHTVGGAVSGILSFRAFFVNNHASAGTITWRLLNASNLLLADGASVVALATRTVALDLANVNGRPLQDDDEMNLEIYSYDPFFTQAIQEVHFQLDVDDGSFTRNYYYIPLRPSDLNATITGALQSNSAKSSQLASQQISDAPTSTDETDAQLRLRLQRRLAKSIRNGNLTRAENLRRRIATLDSTSDPPINPGNPSGGIPVLGINVFTPVRIKISDLQRIGSDLNKTLANVVAIRIRITFANNTGSSIPDDTIGVLFGSWWVGGSFGPDSGDIGTPYTYRFRYRASESGAISNPSPANRSGVIPHRQRVQLSATASSDAQVDKIDWFRFGGSLNVWRYIGTGPNATTTFNDDFPDDTVAGNSGLDFDKYQPFPVLDIPRTGTCTVSGTMITRTSGDSFNPAWAPGSLVIVNGVPSILYRVISASLLEVVDNLGALTSAVSFFIPDALIQGQPLPAMWGPFIDLDGAVRFLACGATNQEGTLFVTTGNDSDSAPADVIGNEITSPSEPLMNGCLFDGAAWVLSNKRMFRVNVGHDTGADNVVRTRIQAQDVPNSKGLYARFGICVAPEGIVFIGEDGIYISNGGEPKSLTNADLYPLFPHDGQPGVVVNGINPPDYTQPNAMTLEFYDGVLYFDYLDTSAARRTLVRTTVGWESLDVYGVGVARHYGEEGRGVRSMLLGGVDGRLYQLLGSTDAGTPISSIVRTGSMDMGDSRAEKLFGDVMVDANTTGANVATIIGFDSYSTLLASQNVNQAARGQQFLDIASGLGQEARNVALNFTWTAHGVELYEWAPSFDIRPIDTNLRRTLYTDLGRAGPKYFYGCRIKADTQNLLRSAEIQADNGINGVWANQATGPLIIQQNGESWVDYGFEIPFMAHLVRLLPTDANQWKLWNIEWLFDPCPPLVLDYVTDFETGDLWDFGHFRDGEVAYIATADITLTCRLDNVDYTYTLPHGAGLYRKFYFPFQPIKFKHRRMSFHSSEPFRLYRRGSWVRGKPWAGQVYQRFNMFGEENANVGPTI